MLSPEDLERILASVIDREHEWGSPGQPSRPGDGYLR